jgi:hypothetical protein
MERKKKDQRRRRTKRGTSRKMSEMVWEFAGGFIRMGETAEERQSLLNAACSAWNIACNPPDVREANLDRYMQEYERHNPDVDKDDLAGVRANMEKLVDKKLEMFPADLRPIVGAQLVQSEGRDRIEIMSARFE